MITQQEWAEWLDLVDRYTPHYDMRELTEKQIIKAMLTYTTIAECLVSSLATSFRMQRL